MPRRAAELLAHQWASLRERFDDVTRRAATRFEARDWHGMHSDAVERLGLYRQTTDAALGELRRSHGSHLTDRALWPPLKQAFSACIAGRADRLLAETFLNSITRRVFATVGVDPGSSSSTRTSTSRLPRPRLRCTRRSSSRTPPASCAGSSVASASRRRGAHWRRTCGPWRA